MYNSKYIIPGIIVFLAVFLFPFWYAAGNPGKAPVLEKPKKAKFCVESAEWMKPNHMQLVDHWRHEVVRNGNRVYTAADGRTWTMSLSNTCFSCHESKENFCDRCHTYAAVKPYCWECHLTPKEMK